MKLQGRGALITGASRGLGLAIARALAREGAAVACLARPGDELTRAVEGLTASGAQAIAAPADVTIEEQVARAIQAATAALPYPAIVELSTGSWQGSPMSETA